jgi:hypothetical protein
MVPHAFTWGGCQRMYFLVKKLKALGIETQVVAMRSASFDTFGKEVFEDTIFTEPKTEIKAGNSNGTAPNKSTGAIGFIRKAAFIGDTFFFNEIQAGNGIKAYQRYRNAKGTLIKTVTQQKYDVAIVSGPPFVVFDAIPLIKKHSPGTRVVMDYRDPWNFWHMGNLLTTQREKRIQRIADTIVCTNDALCADMSVAFSDLAGMFGLAGVPVSSAEFVYYLRSYLLVIVIAIVGATPLPKRIVEKIREKETGNKVINLIEPAVCIILLVLITAYLVDGSFNPFLYFRF